MECQYLKNKINFIHNIHNTVDAIFLFIFLLILSPETTATSYSIGRTIGVEHVYVCRQQDLSLRNRVVTHTGNHSGITGAGTRRHL